MPASGWCLKQSPATGGSIGGIDPDAYDDDTAHADQAGQTVHWLAPG